MGMHQDIQAYNESKDGEAGAICALLCQEIMKGLPKAENKVWHAHPVWFSDGNPLVGYDVMKDTSVRLLFWSGQSFDEPGLKPEGSFKAAEIRYRSIDEVNTDDLQRWLQKAESIQWDYKNIRKRRGELIRIK